MAWMSSGTTNVELVNAMRENGVLTDQRIRDAFLAVDRGLFLPDGLGEAAYEDCPVKVGNIHASAPHIYASVLEALDIQEGVSFLNVGSGTGYVSTLVATLAGPSSINHGIEIHKDVFDFSVERIQAFMQSLSIGDQGDAGLDETSRDSGDTEDLSLSESSSGSENSLHANSDTHATSDPTGQGGDGREVRAHWQANGRPRLPATVPIVRRDHERAGYALLQPRARSIGIIEICHGDIFQVDPSVCERYDRIYIGAGCPANRRKHLTGLLAQGGVLVGPVGDELLKIERIGEGEEGLITHCLAGVRFAPLVTSATPAPGHTGLPRLAWRPDRHACFPSTFRKSTTALMIMVSCWRFNHSLPSRLPKNLWLEILGYCTRDWFTPEPSEVQQLQERLKREVAARKRAEEMAQAANRSRMEAERERDMYRFLFNRLNADMQGTGERGGRLPGLARVFGAHLLHGPHLLHDQALDTGTTAGGDDASSMQESDEDEEDDEASSHGPGSYEDEEAHLDRDMEEATASHAEDG